MARMSIDDGLGRDTRLDDLAVLCGWTKRETAGCVSLDIWPLCYDRVTPNIRARDLDIAANRNAVSPVKHPGGFSAALVESGLARPSTRHDTYYLWIKNDGSEVQLPWRDTEWRDRIYVCGAPERIAYLLKREESGKAGGTKSAETRRKKAKHSSSTASSSASSSASTLSNPSASASASAPDPSPDPDGVRDSASSASPPSHFREVVDRSSAAARRAAAVRVLSRLTQANGIEYTSPEHFELVEQALQLHSEYELRAIVVYCADDLGWAADDGFRGNLAPHVLFVAEKLHKYLDAARSRYATEIAEAQKGAA